MSLSNKLNIQMEDLQGENSKMDKLRDIFLLSIDLSNI